MKVIVPIREYTFRDGGNLQMCKTIEGVYFLFIDNQELWNGLNRKDAFEKYKFYLSRGKRDEK